MPGDYKTKGLLWMVHLISHVGVSQLLMNSVPIGYSTTTAGARQIIPGPRRHGKAEVSFETWKMLSFLTFFHGIFHNFRYRPSTAIVHSSGDSVEELPLYYALRNVLEEYGFILLQERLRNLEDTKVIDRGKQRGPCKHQSLVPKHANLVKCQPNLSKWWLYDSVHLHWHPFMHLRKKLFHEWNAFPIISSKFQSSFWVSQHPVIQDASWTTQFIAHVFFKFLMRFFAQKGWAFWTVLDQTPLLLRETIGWSKSTRRLRSWCPKKKEGRRLFVNQQKLSWCKFVQNDNKQQIGISWWSCISI